MAGNPDTGRSLWLSAASKNALLSAVAVLSLALGIGANTAIFSLVNAVLLRSLPVSRPGELSLLVRKDRLNNRGSFSYPFVQLVRRDVKSFSGVLVTSQPGRSKIVVNGSEQTATTENVSDNYFGVLGLVPAAGRFFLPDEDRPGAADVAVISDGFWRRPFGGDPGVVGRIVEKGGTFYTIVGVSPPEFFGISTGSAVDLWTTLSQVQPKTRNSPGMNFLQMVGRRRPGVTAQAAEAETEALFRHHLIEYTSTDGWPTKEKEHVLSYRIALEPGATGLSSLRLQYSQPLRLLFGMTLLVLLVACANIANLLLARAAARRKEISMRLAIGAGRGRVVRQLMTESLLLAAIGGTAALWFAYGGARLLVTLLSTGRDRALILDVSPDWRILAFSAGISLSVGLLFGIAPALRSTRDAALATRAEIGETRRLTLGKLLIAFQVAITIVLVVGSGLFLGTLRNLHTVQLGFEPDRLYKLDFGLRKGFPEADKPALQDQLPARLAEVPGVLSAALTWPSPLQGGWTQNIGIPSYSAVETPEVYRYRTGPRFFETMRVPLLAGRDFARQDTAASSPVAIINQTLAKQYFAGQNPIGQSIRVPAGGSGAQIVGVAGDTRVQGVRKDPPPIAYTPLSQTPEDTFAPVLMLRLSGKPPDFPPILRAIHPALRAEGGILVTEQIGRQLLQERVLALLSSFFGGLALLLASIGLYGVLSYVLTRRTTEIGVRLALGARPRQVIGMVLGESAIVVALGLAFGIAAAMGLTRLVRQFLFGLSPNDPLTIVAAAATLSIVALLATLPPARRASRLDPMSALRQE